MTAQEVLNTFDPLLTAALERLSKFHDPETKDVVRFFGPCLESRTLSRKPIGKDSGV